MAKDDTDTSMPEAQPPIAPARRGACPDPASVELDDSSTWPADLLSLLEQAYDALQSLDEGACRRVSQEAAVYLVGRDLVAYHCTRLTDDEVADVLSAGLRTFDARYMDRRIERRLRDGAMSKVFADELRRRVKQRTDECRGPELWGVLSHRALADERGLGNPLRYWGGEVLLRLDDGTHRYLETIGRPCVIEFAASTSATRYFCPAQSFVERFLHDRGEDVFGDGGDVCVSGNIPAAQIRRVIQRDDPDFETFTECRTWSFSLR